MTGEGILSQDQQVDSNLQPIYSEQDLLYVSQMSALHAVQMLTNINLSNKMQDVNALPCEGDNNMARKRYNFTLPNGEAVWTTGNTVQDAITNALAKYGANYAQQPPKPKRTITLREFVEKHYKPVYFSSLKPTTQDSYQQFLKLNIYPFMGDKLMSDITVTTIQDFYNWMANASQHGRKKDLNEKTIDRVGGFLSKVFSVAVDLGMVDATPFKKTLLKNPGKPAAHHKPLPRETIDRIRRAIPGLVKERDRFYMALLAYTGMRPEEVLGMCWEDVFVADVDNAYCRVTKTVTYPGASKKAVVSDTAKTKLSLRIVPLPKAAAQMLQTKNRRTGFVLGGDKPLSYSTYKRMYEGIFERLGIKGQYDNYDFRSTYATELCEAGLTSKQVGDLMGHSDSRMVEQVYARSRQEGIMQQLPYLNALHRTYEN